MKARQYVARVEEEARTQAEADVKARQYEEFLARAEAHAESRTKEIARVEAKAREEESGPAEAPRFELG